MPLWYRTMCETWSRAAWRGDLSWDQAASLIDVWHPIALAQKGRLSGRDRIALDMYALLVGAGVADAEARRLTGLEDKRG